MCPIFGIVLSVFLWLDFSLEVLKRVVFRQDCPDFAIRWPTVDEMRASEALLLRNRQNGPLLRGVYAVADGSRMPVATFLDANLQKAYCQGFTQAHEVIDLFV